MHACLYDASALTLNAPTTMSPRRAYWIGTGIALAALAAAALLRQLSAGGLGPSSVLPTLAWSGLVFVGFMAVLAYLGARGKSVAQIPAPIRAGIFIGFLGGFMVVMSPTGPSPLRLLSVMWPFAFAGAFSLIVGGIAGKRVGDALCCPKCDYELGCAPEDAPRLCPECGASWVRRWVKGRRERSPAEVWAGVALLVPVLVFALLRFTSLGAAGLKALPTRGLVAVVASDAWGNNGNAWTEFGRRALSANEHATMVSSLFDLRRAEGYLYGPPAAWLDAEFQAGTLSPEARERFFREMFEPELDAPARVRSGSSALVRLQGTDRTGGSAYWAYAWMDQINADGRPLATAGSNAPTGRWVFSLYLSDRYTPSGGFPDERLAPSVFDTSVQGTRTVRATLFVCVVPRGQQPSQPPIVNGVVTPPPGSVHFRRVELERSVVVDR